MLPPDEQHKKEFVDIPRINFKNSKSLKDHLIRSVLPKKVARDNSGPCSDKRPPSELCKLMTKLQWKSEILTKFITFINHLIAIPKTRYTL